MVEIGKYNTLKIVKDLDFGVYLDGGDGMEILLPARYVPKNVKPGDEVEVFIYHDNEGRLIATTAKPLFFNSSGINLLPPDKPPPWNQTTVPKSFPFSG